MKLQIVALRDIKTDSYSQPQFVVSIGGWLRALGDEVNRADANNNLHNHPEDFEAYHLGEWDDNTATFDVEHDGSLTTPKQLAVLSNYKR